MVPGGGPEHGPAQRRVRHLHRAGHRAQRGRAERDRRLHRRVLRHGPADQVRPPRRAADRLHGVHHGAERGLAQPRRQQGADRLQRVLLRADGDHRLGLPARHLLAARQDLRHLHLVRHPERRRRPHRLLRRPGRQVPGRGGRLQCQRHGRPALRLQRLRGPAVDRHGRRFRPGARQVPGRDLGLDGRRGQGAALRLQRHRRPAVVVQRHHPRRGEPRREQVPGRHRQLLGERRPRPDLVVHGRVQPEVAVAVTRGRGAAGGP
ncbi:hypothetical protein SGPA1_11539 [Streptomyces misionensis JCM 4497]